MRVRTMDEVAAEATTTPRFRARLVGAFAALAIVLAGGGIFSVFTFTGAWNTSRPARVATMARPMICGD